MLAVCMRCSSSGSWLGAVWVAGTWKSAGLGTFCRFTLVMARRPVEASVWQMQPLMRFTPAASLGSRLCRQAAALKCQWINTWVLSLSKMYAVTSCGCHSSQRGVRCYLLAR